MMPAMRLFERWEKLKQIILRHERILWIFHSIWAFSYGIIIMLLFKGDFGKVRKLLLFLMFLMLLIIAYDRVAEYEIQKNQPRRGVKLILNYVMKNMYQALYFFMLPFYWEATFLPSMQGLFTLAVGILAILSTQDLFFDNFLMERKWFRNIYFAFCLLASFHLMLPLLLPLPLHLTLPLAGFMAMFAFFVLHTPNFVWKEHNLRWVIVFSAVAALVLFLARPIIPAVPYSVQRTGVTGENISTITKQAPQGVYFIPVHAFRNQPIHGYSVLKSPTFPHDLFRHEYRHRGKLVFATSTTRQSLDRGTYLLSSSLAWRDLPQLDATGPWTLELTTAGGVVMDSVVFEIISIDEENAPKTEKMLSWNGLSPTF